VYFDPHGNDESADEELSLKLREQTGIPWEIVNEYYAHTWNNLPAYGSTRDAISQWPETVTAIGVYIDEHDTLQLFAPYGIDDLVNFIVRPSPQFDGGIKRVRERVEQKGWIKKWPQIVVVS
jgi:hypothetical protein